VIFSIIRGWVRFPSTSITSHHVLHTIEATEVVLGSPESAHRNIGDLQMATRRSVGQFRTAKRHCNQE
jgi:hypothetical protein